MATAWLCNDFGCLCKKCNKEESGMLSNWNPMRMGQHSAPKTPSTGLLSFSDVSEYPAIEHHYNPDAKGKTEIL